MFEAIGLQVTLFYVDGMIRISARHRQTAKWNVFNNSNNRLRESHKSETGGFGNEELAEFFFLDRRMHRSAYSVRPPRRREYHRGNPSEGVCAILHTMIPYNTITRDHVK